MQDIYTKNLEYLRQFHSGIIKSGEEFEKNTNCTEFYVEHSKSSLFPSIKCETKELSISLNSRIDPLKELTRFLEAEKNLFDYDAYLFADFFGGFECQVLEKIVSEKKPVCYLLFFPEIFFSIIKKFDITFLKEYNVSFEIPETLQKFRLFLEQYYKKYERIKLIPRPHTARLIEVLKPHLQSIAEFINRAEMGKNLTGKFGDLFAENIKKNLKFINPQNGISKLKSVTDIENKTGVLIGAGPSAEHNINEIIQERNDLIIVAVDAAMPILHHTGLTPDFIITVDPQAECARFFDFNEFSPALVFALYAAPEIIEKYRGEKIYFISENHPAIQKPGTNFKYDDSSILRGGSSVSVYALDFLIYLGLKQIIFIGQDFGFTHNLIYAKSSAYYKNVYASLNKFLTAETDFYNYIINKKAVKFRDIFTLNNLKNYLFEFEYYLKNKDIKFYNLNSRGIEISGARSIISIGNYKNLKS